jgi:hypothetical protein
VGSRSLEICALPQVLSPGTLNLERTTLLSAPLDSDSIVLRRDPLSLRRVPLQFCKLQKVQGKIRVAAPGTPPYARRNRIGFFAKELKGRARGNLLAQTHPGKHQEEEDYTGALRERGTRKKWFQVTRWIARSPTGMHGLNMASGSDVTWALCSPQPILFSCGS